MAVFRVKSSSCSMSHDIYIISHHFVTGNNIYDFCPNNGFPSNYPNFKKKKTKKKKKKKKLDHRKTLVAASEAF